MKALSYLFLFVIFFLGTTLTYSQTFEYISPKNNSSLVSLSTNIILRSAADINPSSLSADEFSVVGSKSGVHEGTVKLSDDNKTILFFPDVKFIPNEIVNVTVNPGIKTVDGTGFSKVEFQFKTTLLAKRINLNPLSLIKGSPVIGNIDNVMHKINSFKTMGDTLPADFPTITVDTTNNPASGKIFLDNDNAHFAQTDSIGNFIMILNNDGSVVKYKRTSWPALDFKVQSNGELSYADIITLADGYFAVRWIVLDTSLTPIDTIQCGNGYIADTHDFLLLPNGHSLVFASDPELVNMSQYGGSDSATVIGAIVQELDASKNVVFQWRSWDAIPDTDSYVDLTTKTIDLIHGNAFDVDKDGNILFSMRHLSSIIKIDRQTGKIDWFLGGKENQFTFINEHSQNYPDYFSYQHDIHILPNGDITLFDNGNQHSPQYSRAVEYKLDEQSKTATLVWEYRPKPDIFNFAMGSVQRLDNGNTIIGWGAASSTGAPAFTEVHPDNSIALEMYLSPGQTSYRVFKFPWISQQAKATASYSGEFYQGNLFIFNNPDSTGISINFIQDTSSLYAFGKVATYDYAPINPTFKSTAPIILASYFNVELAGVTSYIGEVHVNLKYFPAVTNPAETIVYGRSSKDSNFVPIATSYDSTKNELVFTTSMTGDFTFGNMVITNVADKNNIVKSYKLYQNYPNPFNPSTIIKYTIQGRSQVRIDIYNAIGQRVTTLVNGMKASGNYEIRWNAANLSSGVYFYAIKANGINGKNFFSVKKMILLK